jgi:ABC-type uncharacterized transport system involved in gliding motility auxiliary subunit
MKNKRLETVLYSTGGVVILLVVLIAANFIGTKAKFRLDFTADKSFTLSAGTRAILKKLDTPVQARLYVSQKEKDMPVVLKDYAGRVQDLLEEYRQVSGGKIQIAKLDPEPDSDAEDSARLDGLEPQMLQNGGSIYFGLVLSMLDQKVVVPLALDHERLLEYDLSRAVSLVMNPTKPVIGVMSALPIFGGTDPMMAMRGGPPQEPAIFLGELKQAFDVKQVEMTADKIDDGINLLLIDHPKDISETTEYAIDQFLMRGGKLIAFIDPAPVFDKSQAQQNPMFGNMPGGKSSLDTLMKAWGLTMDGGKVVADMTYKTQNQNGDAPTVLRLTADAMNKDDVVTSQIDDLVMLLAGAITGKPVDGLTETVLIKTSTTSQLVDGLMAAMGGENVVKDFKPSGVDYALAVQLSGKFKTAFPNGKPAAKGETNSPAPSAESLKESKSETQVVLVADTDMLNDQIVAQVQNFFGQKVITPRFGNLTFVQSLVEKLSGDSNLISVRSRATVNRPFTLVQKMEAAAQEEYRGKIKTLTDSQQEIERKLTELVQQKGGTGQQVILPPEQQKEIENFRKQQVETSKHLKQIRKEFRQDIDSLQNRLKAINLLAMPAAVALCGVTIAVFKRKRTAAK